jgi:hypothetical protein
MIYGYLPWEVFMSVFSRTLVLFACLASLTAPTCLAQAQKRPAAVSDDEITAQVEEVLTHEDALQAKDTVIHVSTQNGIVTIDGHVPNKAAKVLATQEASQIRGVRGVMNNLDYSPSSVQPVPAPQPARQDTYKQVMVQAGTAIPVRLTQEISSKTAKPGDEFTAVTTATVYQTVDGISYPVIPQGTAVF